MTGPAPAQRGARTGSPRGVLHILNSHGGGTERHVLALIEATRTRHRHHVAIASGEHWQVEAHRDDGGVRTSDFRRRPRESWQGFLGRIAAAFRIDLIHLHNISGAREGLIEALAELGLPYGYTVHDLGFACPTIILLRVDGKYCGGETDAAACTRCLKAQPAYETEDIVRWRARHRDLLARCAFLIAPSPWAAAMLARYFPGHTVESIPHGAPERAAPLSPDSAPPIRVAAALPDDGVPTVALLGAIGPHKGARRLERMVDLVRLSRTRVRFVVIGYLDVEHGPWQSDDAVLTIHGPYDSLDLPRLLDSYRAGLVVYPSPTPETFSYTLSEAWAAGRPVVVPPIGALAARVAESGAGWIWTEAQWENEEAMLARIMDLVAPAHADELAAAGERARATPVPTLADMAQRTLALYDAAFAGAAHGSRQLRVRRALYRVMPAAMREALRRRPA